jgi:hypothetical protein
MTPPRAYALGAMKVKNAEVENSYEEMRVAIDAAIRESAGPCLECIHRGAPPSARDKLCPARQATHDRHLLFVPFDWDDAGALSAGQAQEASNASERGARAISHQHAGVVVFSRIGNPAIGEFQEAVILAQFGDVDLNALSE